MLLKNKTNARRVDNGNCGGKLETMHNKRVIFIYVHYCIHSTSSQTSKKIPKDTFVERNNFFLKSKANTRKMNNGNGQEKLENAYMDPLSPEKEHKKKTCEPK